METIPPFRSFVIKGREEWENKGTHTHICMYVFDKKNLEHVCIVIGMFPQRILCRFFTDLTYLFFLILDDLFIAKVPTAKEKHHLYF